MTMNPVVHFEMPFDDRDRMVDFYSKTFGWQANILGPEMGNYVVVATTETDEQHMVKKPGTINGGFYQKSDKSPNPSIVIAVDDIREAMQKVKDAGGTVLGGSAGADEPDDIPGIGLFASIIDTEGNKVGMLQPSPRM
jgi:uncharacterized protein